MIKSAAYLCSIFIVKSCGLQESGHLFNGPQGETNSLFIFEEFLFPGLNLND